MDLELGGEIKTVHAQPVSIELSRGQKGSYGWTIKVHAATPEETLERINTIDWNLRQTYGTPIPEPQ